MCILLGCEIYNHLMEDILTTYKKIKCFIKKIDFFIS